MIVHVVDRAREAGLGEPVVATDSAEVLQAVQSHGGKAVMTRADHPSGSDRIFEACKRSIRQAGGDHRQCAGRSADA
jgi:CMP-2-keto-3-deoxyoctulosonic acid synthetase